MEATITYFEKPGFDNSEEVFRIVGKRAKELGIRKVITATNTGKTGIMAVRALPDCEIICVTHSVGFRKENISEFLEENRAEIEKSGGHILTATHVFGGINRAMRQGELQGSTQTYVAGDIAAATLKCFCQGMKVTVEIASMAADAGLVRTDEEVISIAGTGKIGGGCDTAVVLKPAHAHNLFATQIKEILCKPRR